MPSKDFDGYGFAAGEVRGTRAWRVDSQGRLRGVVFEKLWLPGENVSRCWRTKTGQATVTFGVGNSVPHPIGGSFTFTTGGGNAAALRRCTCGCGQYINNTGSIVSATLSAPEKIANPCEGMDPDCMCGF